MKLKVMKSELKKSVDVIKRVMGAGWSRILSVYLLAEEGFLNVIPASDTFLRYKIPADIEEEGSVSLSFSVFVDLLKLRSEEIVLSVKKNDNTLNIKGGSKLGVFTMKFSPEQYKAPERQWDAEIELSAVSTGRLREIMDRKNMVFTYGSIVGPEQTSIFNGRDGFTVKFADNMHSAYYSYKEPISDSDFEFNTYMEPLRNILQFIDTKGFLKISDTLLMLDAEAITSTIASRQDMQSNYIMQSDIFLEESNYSDGEIVFSANDFLSTLNSVGIIYEDGTKPVRITVSGKEAKLKLETSYGVSEDILALEENTYGEFKGAVSLPLMRDALTSCRSAGDRVSMRISEGENFFCLYSEGNGNSVKCLNPFVS